MSPDDGQLRAIKCAYEHFLFYYTIRDTLNHSQNFVCLALPVSRCHSSYDNFYYETLEKTF